MAKVKIKLVVFGHLPYDINLDKIRNWKSNLFHIDPIIDNYTIIGKSDGDSWEFTDENIEAQLPKKGDEEMLLALTSVPLEDNYFVRRFSDNRVCITYYEMTEILKFNNIPLENLPLRVLYSISFVYKRYGNNIPLTTALTNFTHDDTRGCIFDMNGIKSDIIYSLNKPHICNPCVTAMTNDPNNRIQNNLVDAAQKELKRIRKSLYFEISDWVKRRPILVICISSVVAILIGVVSNAIWAFLSK